jgi:hydrogenase maturation factor
MRVVASGPEALATCVDAEGRSWRVQTDLVGEVARDDELLVHAGVALALLSQGGRR